MSLTARLQAELDHHMMKLLDVLQWLGGLKTKRELLNNALTLLKWAVKERMKGNVICSINERTHERKELEMPYLESVAGNAVRAASNPDVIAVFGLTGTGSVGAATTNTTADVNKDDDADDNMNTHSRKGKRGDNAKHPTGVRAIASGPAALRR
jgi:hypothetical protein